jgi:hypothetical protein
VVNDDDFEKLLRFLAENRTQRRRLQKEINALQVAATPAFDEAWEVFQGRISPQSKYYGRSRGMMEFSGLIERFCEE